VRIAVADEGPGVPEANREKVFQRFFTTDAEHTGTGLGLAIVASVAAASGGRALLDRTERGARFVIELAAAEWKGGMVE
jgi:signal transduction histidine kinase